VTNAVPLAYIARLEPPIRRQRIRRLSVVLLVPAHDAVSA
jgi:hypothetical protein